MHSLAKTTFIIYPIVAFLFVELFHCSDIDDETVTVAIDIKEIATQVDGINTTETITINNQTVTVENTTQAPEQRSVMEMCNETFATPKGTVENFANENQCKHPMVKCAKFVIEMDNYLVCLSFVVDDASPPI